MVCSHARQHCEVCELALRKALLRMPMIEKIGSKQYLSVRQAHLMFGNYKETQRYGWHPIYGDPILLGSGKTHRSVIGWVRH